MPDSATDPRAEFYVLARDVLRNVATELLQHYSNGNAIALEPEQVPSNDEFVLAAAIGFAGPSLNGTLAVAFRRPLLDRLSPLTGMPQELAHGDWIGELSNQLLGRLKNKLVPYGLDIRLGTPAVVEGRELRLYASGKGHIEQRFRIAQSVVCVWLDMIVGEDLSIQKTEDSTGDEGSVILF